MHPQNRKAAFQPKSAISAVATKLPAIAPSEKQQNMMVKPKPANPAPLISPSSLLVKPYGAPQAL